MATRIHPKNVHEKSPKNVHEMSPKKRTFRGQKCPQNVTKSVHEMSPLFSTRCHLLCPRDVCHPKIGIQTYILFTNLKGLDTTICVSHFITVNISSLSIWREKLHTNKVPIPIFFQKHFHHVWFKVLLLAVFSPPTKQVFCLTVSSFSYTTTCKVKYI